MNSIKEVNHREVPNAIEYNSNKYKNELKASHRMAGPRFFMSVKHYIEQEMMFCFIFSPSNTTKRRNKKQIKGREEMNIKK